MRKSRAAEGREKPPSRNEARQLYPLAEPLGDELFTMTVTRAVRVLEAGAQPDPAGKISPELYSAVSSVLVYTARLLTNTNSEKGQSRRRRPVTR